MKKLGEIEIGKIVKIGDLKVVVLNHNAVKWDNPNGSTELILADRDINLSYFGKHKITGGRIVHQYEFRNLYYGSNVREYCTHEYVNKLKNIVGKDNIVTHIVYPEALGSYYETPMWDDVSVLSPSRFHKYYNLLPIIWEHWWLSVGGTVYGNNSFIDYYYADYYGYNLGKNIYVRPYFVLKSCLMVEEI